MLCEYKFFSVVLGVTPLEQQQIINQMDYLFNQPNPLLITEEIDSSNSTFYNVIDNRQTRSFQKFPFIIANKLLHGHLGRSGALPTKKFIRGFLSALLSCILKPDLAKTMNLIVVGALWWCGPMTRVLLYIITRRLKEGLVELGLERRQLYMSDQMRMRH